jgi:hypothetical protein
MLESSMTIPLMTASRALHFTSRRGSNDWPRLPESPEFWSNVNKFWSVTLRCALSTYSPSQVRVYLGR